MFSLIRFFKKEKYANQFLDGNLFMNSIGQFWGSSIEPQNDLYEGVTEVLSVKEIKEQYGFDFKEIFGEHILLPIANRLEAYKYVHLLCMSMISYDHEYKEVEKLSSQMANFGKYAVKVNNFELFVGRLFDKLRKNGQYGLMGPVQYHNPREESSYRDCFDKNTLHKNEKEWRFALIPDYERAKQLALADAEGRAIYKEYTIFSIGDIRDIAQKVNVDTLLNDPGSLYRDEKKRRYKTVEHLTVSWEDRKKQIKILERLGFPIPYDVNPEQYVGWGPREAFREKVLQLNRGLKPLLTIGG